MDVQQMDSGDSLSCPQRSLASAAEGRHVWRSKVRAAAELPRLSFVVEFSLFAQRDAALEKLFQD